MANGTPESEFSIECFQNYSAPEVFVQGLAGMVDQNDVELLIRAQKNMLQRFEKTTEMLTNCNQLSENRLRAASVEFKRHTQLLLDMKKDLNYIFKKIRIIKTKLSTQYPEAYQKALESAKYRTKPLLEEDEHIKPSTSKMVTTVSTETLKPMPNETFKKIRKKDLDNCDDEKPNIVARLENVRIKSNSSSSETESASSGDEASTDTG